LAGQDNGGGVASAGLPGSPTPPRLDHRYEVTDRTGLSMGVLPVTTIHALVRQGRLFRTDKVSKDGAAPVMMGDLPEFQSVFDDTVPPAFQVGGAVMRPRPDVAGALDRTALAGIFARLHQESRTGRLFIVGPERRQEKVVIFQRGVPVNAMSNIAEEQLGELLMHHGVITAETFDQALVQRRDHGGRLGSALIAIQAMTPRELHRALSIQAMERLLNAFRQQEGTFRFVPDETAADEEILLFATPREIIETGLHASLSPAEIAQEIGALGEATLAVRTDALGQPWATALQPGDSEVLGLVGNGKPVALAVDQVARTLRLTSDEARLKLLALTKFGLIGVGEVGVRALEEALGRLQSVHAFDALGLTRGSAVAEVAPALEHKLDELGGRAVPGESPATTRLREKIRSILEAAARTLTDENLRPMYERALQLGLDFDQPEVRSRLEYEHNLNKGKTALTLQRFDEARRAFIAATEAMPEEPMAYVHLGWSQFLASAKDSNAASAAVREVERALRLQSELDAAHMTVGKIHRLAGHLDLAEKHLRHAIALNPHNNEAQSELRLIFTRELDGKAPGQRQSIKLDAGLPATLGLYFVVFGIVLVLANFVGTDLTEFPESIRPESNHLIEIPKEIPQDWRVFGILEYYYFATDPMWWARRALLLVAGLLGMRFLVNRDRKSPVSIVGENMNWVFLALPYGLLVGFLSPVQVTAEALGLTLAMTLFHCLAEQIFFIGFLSRALLKEFREPGIGLGITALLFGLYHVSYWSILHEPTRLLILDTLQIGAFAGGAYAALYWRSGGMLAPFLAHVTVNSVMMVNSYMRYHQGG
jgi:membrane protease YdiL (CAAX protease family)